MGAARMLSSWTRSVRSLVPDLHGHQLKTLTLMALSMCCSGLCQITRMVLDAPVPVKIASTRRRFERFLANDRVDPVQISMQLARSLMQPWQGQTIRLFIDETALGPWLLVTSLPAQLKRCKEYRSRMWQEEAFRDEKSHGFHWQRSRVRRTDHADRLLLVMLLATWMTIIVGAELIRRGQRALVEATSRASLSVFQLGYRAWTHLKQPLLPRGPTIQLDPVHADQKSVG
jgi:hypothetical protein